MSYFKGITKITKELYVEKLAKGEIDPDRLYFVYDADNNYTREEIDALFVTLENALQSSVADINAGIAALDEKKANADNVYTKEESDATYAALQEDLQSSVSAINEGISELDKKKYDKTGGIVTGDVAIQGNLSVAGTTTQKDTETLRVQDNVIVANANGVELIEEGGFAIKTDTTNVYGIMYDPIGDGVKIGLGTFDENGKFIFTEGEAQFLATRADEIADGNLPKWNNEKKRFDDSGEKIEDFQKSTDETLETTAKQVAGAINEVNEKTNENANSLTALVEALAELMPEVVRLY